jgi:acyl-CoA synthetase (AMP-forming)/AMP-acid ligase II
MMKVVFEAGSVLQASVNAVVEAATRKKPFALASSGTTGVPKTIHRDLASALAKKGTGRPSEKWLLTYSPERWAGVSVILHVLKAGATLCVPQSLAFEDVIAAGDRQGITHISLTPSMFRNLLMNDQASRLENIPVEQVTFGGEAATQSVLDQARRTWTKARVTHVYASTEVGDICSVSDGLEGVPIHKLERFSFAQGGQLVIDGQRTGDIWERRGDRYYFLGRIEEIINVGGNKVSPLAVEEFAIQCGALFARAFAISSPLMGSLVGLEYVGGLDESELMKSFRKQFPKYMCPAQIMRLKEIGLSDAGKNRRLS